MKDFSVWPGVLIVCFVAITILTIFPSKHKQCIDRNSTIIEKLQENDADNTPDPDAPANSPASPEKNQEDD